MFEIGDRVQRKTLDNAYTGTVIGFHLHGSRLHLDIKRDDGHVGGYGDFWRVPASYFNLLEPVSLENK